jgi:DNA-binding transcriptional ArsR family regulator
VGKKDQHFDKSESESLKATNFSKLLQDRTRLQIIIYLLINGELTLKELSELFNKGKTTVHHHLHMLQQGGLVTYYKHEDDPRNIKTHYYRLSDEYFDTVKGTEDNEETKSSPKNIQYIASTNNLIGLILAKYLADSALEYNLSITDKKREELVQMIPNFHSFCLTKETIPIFNDFIEKVKKASSSESTHNLSSSVQYIITNILLPEQLISTWKEKEGD